MMAAFTYPTIGTMPSRALCLLLQGQEITHLDFWRIANTYRLSDPIFQLRQGFGWEIHDRRATVPTGDPTKRSASVAFYRLPDEVIAAAGEEVRDYVQAVLDWIDKASRKAGAGESAPANRAAGTHWKGTDEMNDTTGGGI